MLGKRPPQIQRSTSMSQLRVPPGARTRPTSTFAHAKKDFVSQNDSSLSAGVKAAAAYNLQPNAPEDVQQMEVKIESPQYVNTVNVGVSPSAHAHMHGHLKAPHLPLKVGSSSAFPLHVKHTMVDSFLDACFFCNKPLGHGRDIFMYRGDAAFCTEECRLRQISWDEKFSMSASQSATSENTEAGSAKSARINTRAGAF